MQSVLFSSPPPISIFFYPHCCFSWAHKTLMFIFSPSLGILANTPEAFQPVAMGINADNPDGGCIDNMNRSIPNAIHFVPPGRDLCKLCLCENGRAKVRKCDLKTLRMEFKIILVVGMPRRPLYTATRLPFIQNGNELLRFCLLGWQNRRAAAVVRHQHWATASADDFRRARGRHLHFADFLPNHQHSTTEEENQATQ